MTYEEYLEKNGEMTYTNRGVSMLPLLKQDRDMFTVRRKGEERCRKYDVILYRRPPESYVLHRVVKVCSGSYVTLGDNCLNKENNILEENVIGVMTGFIRKGREHSVNELPYRLYSRFIVFTYPLRKCFKKAKNKLRQILKK